MIFWYEHLYMDEKLRHKEKQCKKIIEHRRKWKKYPWQMLPWKKNYYVLALASNQENLFDIMNTDQMFFRYYEHQDLYVLGVSENYDGAVEILQQIMTDGFHNEPEFDPRKLFTKDRFRNNSFGGDR